MLKIKAFNGDLLTKDSRHYKGFGEIDPWIIRNLMSYGNCFLKTRTYAHNLADFIKLFGKRNITVKLLNANELVMSINDIAKTKAKVLIY